MFLLVTGDFGVPHVWVLALLVGFLLEAFLAFLLVGNGGGDAHSVGMVLSHFGLDKDVTLWLVSGSLLGSGSS